MRDTKRPASTVAHRAGHRPADLVIRTFAASRPRALQPAEFAHVATPTALMYLGFVIDVVARIIAGRRAADSLPGELTREASEQPLWARKLGDALIHHLDRGSAGRSIDFDGLIDAAV